MLPLEIAPTERLFLVHLKYLLGKPVLVSTTSRIVPRGLLWILRICCEVTGEAEGASAYCTIGSDARRVKYRRI